MHSALGERNTGEMFISVQVHGSNIANHAWTNNHKIDFNSGKLLTKATIGTIDILYTLDSASNYSAIQKLKP